METFFEPSLCTILSDFIWKVFKNQYLLRHHPTGQHQLRSLPLRFIIRLNSVIFISLNKPIVIWKCIVTRKNENSNWKFQANKFSLQIFSFNTTVLICHVMTPRTGCVAVLVFTSCFYVRRDEEYWIMCFCGMRK
jgi:hypothetical protein